ncbi:MAG: hypothetical protein ACOZIN_20760 [Myxococcota bacterium]
MLHVGLDGSLPGRPGNKPGTGKVLRDITMLGEMDRLGALVDEKNRNSSSPHRPQGLGLDDEVEHLGATLNLSEELCHSKDSGDETFPVHIFDKMVLSTPAARERDGEPSLGR